MAAKGDIKFAYVRFIDDDITDFVEVQNIKRLDIQNINFGKKYLAKWGHDGEFYEANIIYVGGK